MHGARVIALRGNFDQALELVRELVRTHPIALVNSVNAYRLEGQKTAAFELVEELGELDALCIPVGNAGNITAYWKGFGEAGHAPALHGFQAEGARRSSSAGGWRGPRPWRAPSGSATRALGGGDDGGHRVAGDDRRRLGRRDRRRLQLLASREGVFCEPASAASVAGLLKHGASGARRVVCVLSGHGLKDPQTALEQSGSVVPCQPSSPPWRKRSWPDGPPVRRPRPGLEREPRPGFDAFAAALDLQLEAEVQETGRFAVETGPGHRPRPAQPARARLRRLHPPDRFTFRIRSAIPLSGGWARAPRRTWRAARPPTRSCAAAAGTCSRTPRSSRASGQRRRRAAGGLVICADGEAVRLDPPAGSRRCSWCPGRPCGRRRPGPRCPPPCRWPTPWPTSPTARC
jgi:hypothetical protein